ncbi:hypothetical protein BDZ89DRAFT_395866 [Hymenopellis radicata]|nr:hypothetical protein BDZ89DRAFT_395866 [Hymenopellis radicata]
MQAPPLGYGRSHSVHHLLVDDRSATRLFYRSRLPHLPHPAQPHHNAIRLPSPPVVHAQISRNVYGPDGRISPMPQSLDALAPLQQP